MERTFKRWTWIIHLLVIACCAVFAGRATAHLLESSFLVEDETPVRRRPVPPAPVSRAHDKDPTALIARNIFCSGCVPPEVKRAAEIVEEQAKREPQKTSLQLSLLAVLLTPDESTSQAVIRELSTKQKDAWRFSRGDLIFDTAATVEHVFARRVYLRNGDHLEYLDLDDKPAPPATPPPAHPGVAIPTDALASAIDHGVSCSGLSCQVDRGLVEQLLRNPMALATSARFIPAMRDGRSIGFRVFAIRPGSLFSHIGLQNGDTIRAINGNDMSSPDQALALYSKLRSASHLSVQLERAGAAAMLDYVIR